MNPRLIRLSLRPAARRPLVLCAALVALAAARVDAGAQTPATAQGTADVRVSFTLPEYRPSGTGRWLPRNEPDLDRCKILTPAEEKQLLAVLEQVSRIFRVAPPLNPPQGVEARSSWTVGARDCDHRPASAEDFIQFFNPTFKITHESSAHVFVVVNPDHDWLRGGKAFTDEQGNAYHLPQQTGTVDGFPVFKEFGNRRLFYALIGPSRPPWLPVSAERYLEHRIAEIENTLGTLSSITSSAYGRWLKEAPQRKEAREELHKVMVTVAGPDSAARVRETMERDEIEMGRQIQQQSGQQSAQLAARDNPERKELERLKAQLAGMSAAQRNAQAWLGNIEPMGFGLVDPSARGAFALVTPNPDFYDRKRPRIEVQAILVEFYTHDDAYTQGLASAVFQTLDWRSLAALIR